MDYLGVHLQSLKLERWRGFHLVGGADYFKNCFDQVFVGWFSQFEKILKGMSNKFRRGTKGPIPSIKVSPHEKDKNYP